MIKRNSLLLVFTLCWHAQFATPLDSLRTRIQNIVKTVNAEIGIALTVIEQGDTLTFNGNKHFPMQSVYKFHLGLAILDLVDKGKLQMDQKVRVTKEDYFPTWSPMASKYQQAEVEIPLSELLMFSVVHSDNVACDVLFRLAGGPAAVQKFIEGTGAKNVAIVATEREMHAEWNVQFDNWNTPYDMSVLLTKFYQRKFLTQSSYDFMWKAMVDCSTGPRRIKGLLPPGTEVAHRTGTGGPNDKGVLGAVNNVGIITLPNGKHVAIAFYITRSVETQTVLEEVIAKVSKEVYDHFSKN